MLYTFPITRHILMEAIKISRTARNFPTNLIFKPGMINKFILLIKYWILNKKFLLKYVSEVKSKN